MTVRCGVYYILNKINQRIYVGSSIDIDDRLHSHFQDLRNNVHFNKYLQLAYNTYGRRAFTSHTILVCQPELRECYEKQIVDQLKPNVYNIAEVGPAFHTGCKHSEDAKKRMSISHKGIKLPEETRHNMSMAHKGRVPWNKGIKATEEAKHNMSKSDKGRKHGPMSEEHKLAISVTKTGTKASEETKHMMSMSRKGRIPWNKGKKGHKASEETKHKISVALIGNTNGKGNSHKNTPEDIEDDKGETNE